MIARLKMLAYTGNGGYIYNIDTINIRTKEMLDEVQIQKRPRGRPPLPNAKARSQVLVEYRGRKRARMSALESTVKSLSVLAAEVMGTDKVISAVDVSLRAEVEEILKGVE